jgi:hypothetical protein
LMGGSTVSLITGQGHGGQAQEQQTNNCGPHLLEDSGELKADLPGEGRNGKVRGLGDLGLVVLGDP